MGVRERNSMAIYDGRPYAEGDVSLTPVGLDEVLRAVKSDNYASRIDNWARLAATRADILYFGISVRSEVVGQIFLHEWDREAKTSLVGYHLYKQEERGWGIGTKALRLLQRYVAEETDLQNLVAITSDDNLPSRGVGRKNGFVEVGASREDPEHGTVMRWRVEKL
jgi:RimJ/RimL family protein N-acetyltransferase